MIRPLTLCVVLSLSVTACAADQPDDATDTAAGGKSDSLGGGKPAGDSFLHCWDYTFAYNMMTLTDDGETTEFILQGADVNIGEYAPNEGNWNPSEVTVSVPSDGCIRSADDPRVLACGAGDVPVHVVINFENAIDGVLEYFRLETTHTVRTDAGGDVRESIEMHVNTQTQLDRGHYAINFPLDGNDPCTTEPL